MFLAFQTWHQIHEVASHIDPNQQWNIYRRTDRTNISKHSTTSNVVQSYKVDNAMSYKVNNIESWPPWKQELNDKNIKQLTKRKSLFLPLLWLPCDVHQWIGLWLLFMSLTQKPVYRHVPYEARGLHESQKISGLLFDLLNDVRGPAADGSDRRTCSTDLIDKRLCSRTKKTAYIKKIKIFS